MQQDHLQTLKQEAQFQSRCYQNLKKWLKGSIILSSLFLSVLACGMEMPALCRILDTAAFIFSAAAMLLFGLALKHGEQNLNQIFRLIDAAHESDPQKDSGSGGYDGHR